MDLKVKFPMLLDIENKGSVYLINKWGVEDRTRHVEALQLFLCNIKESGFSRVRQISGDDNEVGLFTKNLLGYMFENNCVKFNGEE